MVAYVMAALVAEGADPITALLTRDWAALGGWGLFLSLGFTIILGAFKGWWVPGWMYRQQSETLKQAMEQNGKLLVTADISKHFYESMTPKQGGETPA